jgi:hypothetical protein
MYVQMRICFRPFRLFLSTIGRFPYKVVKEKGRKDPAVGARQRTGSSFPLLNGFVHQVCGHRWGSVL